MISKNAALWFTVLLTFGCNETTTETVPTEEPGTESPGWDEAIPVDETSRQNREVPEEEVVPEEEGVPEEETAPEEPRNGEEEERFEEPATESFGIGVVRIDTRGVEVDEEGDDWIDVDLEVVEAKGALTLPMDSPATWSGFGAIHLRGNSTMGYEKKQYALETRDEAGEDIDVDFFGLPKEEDWVLAAPYSDKTLIRNHLMFQWSRAIGRYAPRTRFVEVYMETGGDALGPEDYRGVYVLTEKVKRDGDRVDVEKLTEEDNASPEVEGGYLLKRDWVEGDAIQTAAYGDEIMLLYPKADAVTPAQRDFIENYLNLFEGALEAEDGSHTTFADLSSFADHMLMMELSRNVDAYVLSTYMHKGREGLLTMGPVWDFNGSLGNADYFESWKSDGWHYENPEFPGDNPQGFRWYEKLLETDDFKSLLSAQWTAHRNGPWATEKLLKDIDNAVALLTEAQVRNFEKWDVLGEYIWPNDFGAVDRESYSEEIDYLKTWLQNRLTWLDSQLLSSP